MPEFKNTFYSNKICNAYKNKTIWKTIKNFPLPYDGKSDL